MAIWPSTAVLPRHAKLGTEMGEAIILPQNEKSAWKINYSGRMNLYDTGKELIGSVDHNFVPISLVVASSETFATKIYTGACFSLLHHFRYYKWLHALRHDQIQKPCQQVS